MMTKKLAGCLAAAAAVAGSTLAMTAPTEAAPSSGADAEIAGSYVCLYRIYADNTQDGGTDEPYLMVDLGRFWGPLDMVAGTSRSLNETFPAGDQFSLYEEDWPDADDFLGKRTVPTVSSGDVKVLYFGSSTAGYGYRISVRPLSYCS